MKRILVPTDFSNNAYNALFFATRFFKKEACTFYILHTFEVNTPVFTHRKNLEKGRLKYKEQQAEVDFQLNALVHAITRDTEDLNHNFETISVSKPLKETIKKTIEKKQIDMVVMGTKGASGLKEFFWGSNTVKVFESLFEIPLLLVPNEVEKTKIKEIGIACSFHKKIKENAISEVMKLSEISNHNLNVIHISSPEGLTDEQEKNKKLFEKSIQHLKYYNIYLPKMNTIENHIIEITEEFDIDLLVMVKFLHDDYYKLTHEPVLKKLGYHIKTPMLVIPN